MKYMLLIYLAEDAMSQTEREHCYVESAQLAQQLHAKGKFLATAPLHPVSMTTSIQMRDGNRLMTDGPFMETREQLGGFFLIDAKNLDEAIAWAAKCPGAKRGSMEVRPIVDFSQM